VHVLVSKYAWHLPLYRQAQIMLAQGIEIDRSVLAFWVGYAAAELMPLWRRMREILLGSARLFVDETRAPVLDPGRGCTKKGYFWSIARDDRAWGSGADRPAVLFTYAPGRGGVHATTLLEGYCGIVQCDGYAVYEQLADPARQGGAVIRSLKNAGRAAGRLPPDLQDRRQRPSHRVRLGGWLCSRPRAALGGMRKAHPAHPSSCSLDPNPGLQPRKHRPPAGDADAGEAPLPSVGIRTNRRCHRRGSRHLQSTSRRRSAPPARQNPPLLPRNPIAAGVNPRREGGSAALTLRRGFESPVRAPTETPGARCALDQYLAISPSPEDLFPRDAG
jgi:hypothetical protein